MAEEQGREELFGYGTGYVPQVDKLIKTAEDNIPDILLDYFMNLMYKDAKAQGIDLQDDDDDNKMDLAMETVADISHGWAAKVREAANSGDEEALHYMLLPF